jgi:hypothetical protein
MASFHVDADGPDNWLALGGRGNATAGAGAAQLADKPFDTLLIPGSLAVDQILPDRFGLK